MSFPGLKQIKVYKVKRSTKITCKFRLFLETFSFIQVCIVSNTTVLV